MSETHEMKCWPEPFAALRNGTKTFELRRDDRGFATGDALVIYEWVPGPELHRGDYRRKTPAGPRQDPLRLRVTYVLHGGRFGLPEGLVVMSVVMVESDDE